MSSQQSATMSTRASSNAPSPAMPENQGSIKNIMVQISSNIRGRNRSEHSSMDEQIVKTNVKLFPLMCHDSTTLCVTRERSCTRPARISPEIIWASSMLWQQVESLNGCVGGGRCVCVRAFR